MAVALVAGAVIAPSTAAVRSVWSDLLAADAEARQAGYALIGMLQEVAFVAGPLVAGAVIGLWSTTAAVAASAGAHARGRDRVRDLVRRAGGARRRAGGRARGSPPRPGMLTVLMSAAAFGASFGALDVALPAFARDHGSVGRGGRACCRRWPRASASAAFVYGPAPAAAGGEPPLRAAVRAGGARAAAADRHARGSASMLALAVLAGLCFAPVTTTQIAVLDEVAPRERPAEAFSWLAILYGAGAAAGAALGGQLVARRRAARGDRRGVRGDGAGVGW